MRMRPKTYLVGGAVRDMMMGKFPKDQDFVVVGASAEFMLEKGYTQVGADFPVFLNPNDGDEYALARREKKTGPGYHGFTCEFGPDVTLEEDLGRRDLTINAIALVKGVEYIDPYGGQRDIRDKILRHVDPDAFVEDPVRVLRLARFAARFPDFTVHEETKELVYSMGRSGALSELTPERVYAELSKALMAEEPRRFFDTLRDCDVLHILFPEVYGLLSAPEWIRHHPEGNAYEHTMLVVTAMRHSGQYDLADMFNALCHDFGKAITPREMLPSHNGHEKAGLPIIEDFMTRLRAPSQIAEYALRTTRYHMYMHLLDTLTAKSLCKMFDEADRGVPDFTGKLVKLGKADQRGRLGSEKVDMDHLNILRSHHRAYQSPKYSEVVGDRKLAGLQIKQEMHKARIAALKESVRDAVSKSTGPTM